MFAIFKFFEQFTSWFSKKKQKQKQKQKNKNKKTVNNWIESSQNMLNFGLGCPSALNKND